MGLPATFDDDTPLVIDSYAAVWIQHLLEERHGVVVMLSQAARPLDSLTTLHDFVNQAHESTNTDDTHR